jgi:hypothetical protein
MGLFNKKPKTAEDILKLIKELPEGELDKLGDLLSADEDENGKPDTIEEIEKAEENIEAKGEDTQTEKDRIDESVAEQEKNEGDEDTQNAKDRVDEAEGEEKALEKEDDEKPEETSNEDELEREEKEQDVFRAFEARLDEIEERIANIVSKLDGGDFGNHSAEITEQESDGETEDSRIMNSYMRKQAFRR